MISIVAVNCQNDFLETGSFPVVGFKPVVDRISRYVEKNYKSICFYYHVMDCHPQNHFSFSANGGKFPAHCIENTHGQESCLPEEIYSVAGNLWLKSWQNIGLKGINASGEDLKSQNPLDKIYRDFKVLPWQGVNELIICGNSLDYSVKQTALYLMKQGHKINVRVDLCTCLGNFDEVLKEYDAENIPYTYNDASISENVWKVTDKKNYVLIQKIHTEEVYKANGGENKVQVKSISADAIKGRFIVTPKTDGGKTAKGISEYENYFSWDDKPKKKEDEDVFDIPDEQYEQAIEILKKQFQHRFGFVPQYEWGKTNYKKLKNFVRFPLMPQLVVLESEFPEISTGLFDKRLENDALEYALKRFCVSSIKTLRRIFPKNPDSAVAFILLVSKLGFKDMNVVNDLISDERRFPELCDCDSSENDFLNWWHNRWATPDFCRMYMGRLGERKVVRLLDSAYSSTEGWDSLNMLLRIHEQNELDEDLEMDIENAERKIFREGFTEYNHRLLIGISNEIRRRNPYPWEVPYEYAEFEYSETEKKLEKEIDGYEFRLAKDSEQLVEISQNMSNCVGHAYQERARNHECIIAYATQDGAYKICIELIPQKYGGFSLSQCLGYGNEQLKGELLEVCKKWISECNIYATDVK